MFIAGWFIFPLRKVNMIILFTYFIRLQSLLDFTVVTSAYFYITNLEFRYQTLNDLWKLFPVEIVTVPGQWTCSKITIFLEDIRLLHAELSNLLKIFSLAYGPILLVFYVFGYIDIIMYFFYLLYVGKYKRDSVSLSVMSDALTMIVLGQNVAFIMSSIVAASHVIEKVNNYFS